MSSLFNKDIKLLKGVGERRTELLKKLGVDSVGALLLYYPRTYEDLSCPILISEALIDEPCCIRAKVISGVSKRIVKNNMTLYSFQVFDGITAMDIVFFNNPYIRNMVKMEESLLLYGKVNHKGNRKTMVAPKFFKGEKNEGLYPVYNCTMGITSRQIEVCVKNAIKLLPDKVNDPIPLNIREKYKLCDLKFAIENIHFPKSYEDLQNARKRLVFEELLILQLGINLSKEKEQILPKIRLKNDYTYEFEQLLSFTPTDAQTRVIQECIEDMSKSMYPLSRLIQGDVGSGKTAVAAAVSYSAVKNGMQVAMMAPTEILAEQHYKYFSNLFNEQDINIAFLSGTVKISKKRRIKEEIKTGSIDILVGTHAIISEDVEFNNLGLVITDEQHRFGVRQRAALYSKGNNPHMIVMSATPIPRTLALILYGDLDISILDELPPGRQKVDTFHINTEKRNRLYGFLKKQIDSGYQGYIVCPLVEENDTNLISATGYAEDLQKTYFQDYRIGLIHGKMKSREKEEIMSQFKCGKIDILVSTTVIEVGVDVPNANFIVIENAERFGLSQLHQLRGRVGRGKNKSYCIIVSDAQNEEAIKRFKIMVETNDGFKIADEDLKLRGPGDFFGDRQHGLPQLKIANFCKDIEIVFQSKDAVKEILDEDPKLQLEKNKGLRAFVRRLFNGSYCTFN